MPNVKTFKNEAIFEGCVKLKNLSFPEVEDIGIRTFEECLGLETLFIPSVKSLGHGVFDFYGGSDGADITIIMGEEAPTIGHGTFRRVDKSRNVIVKVPAGSDYGLPFDNGDTTTENWGNGFKGMGWDGTGFSTSDGYEDNSVNENINLTIQEYSLD